MSVQALYSCGGPNVVAVATAPARTVALRPEIAPITLKPVPHSCVGQTIRVEALPVPGATGYNWYVPYPFSPQGTTVTTQPFLDITSDATALNRRFTIQVQALSSAGCTPSTAQQTGLLGPGAEVTIGSDAPRTGTEICPNSSFSLQAAIDGIYAQYAGYQYTFAWTVTTRNGGTILSSYSDYSPVIYVTTPAAGNWLDVSLQVSTSCGNFYLAYGGWQLVNQFQDGGYCIDQGFARQPATETDAYPNPADERLQLPSATGTYTLYDGHGRPVRQQRASPKAAGDFSTRQLPAGLYYLVRQDGQGRATRQTIQVRH